MEAYELNHNSISDKTKKESRVSLDNEKILCNHCKIYKETSGRVRKKREVTSRSTKKNRTKI